MKRYIEVTGHGTAAQPADLVDISLSLIAQQQDYAKTIAQSATQLSELQQALADMGFEKDVIQTRNYQINTHYVQDPDSQNYQTIFGGYRLQHDLVMSFDYDNEKLNKLLEKLANLSDKPEFYLSFRVKDATAAAKLALERAVTDAKEQAKELAQLTGVKLGKIQFVVPQATFGGRPPMLEAKMDRAYNLEFPTGENTINRQITIRFAIE